MKNERLNGLALMHVHKDIEPTVNEVLTIFSQQHPRWAELQ